MDAALPSLLIGFASTVIFTLLLRGYAPRVGLMDHPGGRKLHAAATPVVGGLAIFGGLVLGLPLAPVALSAVMPLLAGMAGLLVCGLLDDQRDLSSATKLIVQVAIAAVALGWGGLWLDGAFDLAPLGMLELGVFSIPVTLIAVVGLVNAVNMFDGLDGLAGGVVASMLLWLAIAAYLNGLPDMAVLAVLLAACVLGFLAFNARHPLRMRAAVFLGDSGSLLLGFAIAWLCIAVIRTPVDSPVGPAAVACVVALPVMDTVSLIVRRIRKGYSPLVADREHLHHIFMRAGLSATHASWLLVGLAFAGGGLGVGLSVLGVPDLILVAALLVAVVLHAVFVSRAWRVARALRRLRATGPAGAEPSRRG